MKPAACYPLTFLDEVRWQGSSISGERTQELLALLVSEPRRGISDADLIEAIWHDDSPANPGKALQVVVSRARSAARPDVVIRSARGYQLGLAPHEVDVLALSGMVEEAGEKLACGDFVAARVAAERAMGLAEPVAMPQAADVSDASAASALAALRGTAASQSRRVRRILGLALAAGGDHDGALEHLSCAFDDDPRDEAVLAALLRSEAAIRGAAPALDRFERYRRRLADTTGSDPGPELQRLQTQLLAADHPIREGIQFDATDLLGRGDDVRALHGLLQSARLVSIVGPGGLGKTRLAHVLGRGAEQSVVRFVELVGVTASADVVGEVGSALGVRDSVSAQRSLSVQQRADLRSRIATQLDRVPTLLILDNCEHVIDAAADFAAFLVSGTRDLVILTTSRTPLNVAAERVYALEQLETADAAELFRRRALAARPAAALPEDVVTDIVTRLDGLPLAIELAAAKVRVMSVDDVAVRLTDRFTLLRGGDRSAPDRHQTLLAVIDWSWNLLSDADRLAMRWLSVFLDGFTLGTAEAVIGDHALEAVQHLVDQSLVTVRDVGGGTRYGMLETVREFGRMQLSGAGEQADALTAQSTWARDYARRAGVVMATPRQIDSLDHIHSEEANLADVLRRSLAEQDHETAILLLAALIGYWSVRGEHDRVLALADAVDDAFASWSPPDELADPTRVAMAAFATNWMFMGASEHHAAWRLLRELGPGSSDGALRAMTTVILACDPERADQGTRVRELCDDPDPAIACHAWMLQSHELENAGDPAAAAEAIRRALNLVPGDIGPWLPTVLRGTLAELWAQLGRLDDSAAEARRALPIMERLDALDDIVDMRLLLAAEALDDERLDDAQAEVDAINDAVRGHSSLPTLAVGQPATLAEIALARGDLADGLSTYRDAVATVRKMPFARAGEPTGTEPWTLYLGAAALSAHALYGSEDESAGNAGAELFDWLSHAVLMLVGNADVDSAGADIDAGSHDLDFPVVGSSLFALALWGLCRGALGGDTAIRLALIADRFGYNRRASSLAWRHVAATAERVAPGRLDVIAAELAAEYDDARGAALLATARDIVISAFGRGPQRAADSRPRG